jgi:hypothetical protein
MIQLTDLAKGMPAITPAFGRYLSEATAVCLESQGHKQGKMLSVQGIEETNYSLTWPAVTEQILRCLNDPEVATGHGAVGIAVLLTKKLLGYSVIQRSRKGTGFDYWLGEDSAIPFQNKARLEISGIRKGDDASIRARVKQKQRQTDPSDETGLPAHVVVVEFSRPAAQMEEK